MMVHGETAPGFKPVRAAFARIVGSGPGGGALAVKLGGETVYCCDNPPEPGHIREPRESPS